VYAQKGLRKESEAFLKKYKDFANQDKTLYRPLWISMYHVYEGNDAKAIEYLFLRQRGAGRDVRALERKLSCACDANKRA
jgi:hypothetical protein